MARRSFTLDARVDTASPDSVRPALRDLLGEKAFELGGKPGEFVVKCRVWFSRR